MSTTTEVKYQLLQTQVGQVELKELLQPHFSQLFNGTINTTKLALILFKKQCISFEEMESCLVEPTSFYQNLELYKILMKKNAGAALIDALEQTENAQILQLLQAHLGQSEIEHTQQEPDQTSNLTNSPTKHNIAGTKSTAADDNDIPDVSDNPNIKDNLRLSPTSFFKVNAKQISILKQVSKVRENSRNCWMENIGAENFSRLHEDNFNWTLVRVAITSDGENFRKYFYPNEFDQEEKIATIKFLETELQFNLEEPKMGRPPHEMYINTRSFTHKEWEWLSKLLLNFCRDSLENLWLRDVNVEEYSKGTEWMTSLDQDNKLRFTKLKFYIFQTTKWKLDTETLPSILLLIKSNNYSLKDFWDSSACQLQIWRYNDCQVLMDPVKQTLCFHADGNDFVEIDKFLNSSFVCAESIDKQNPIVKLYYSFPQANFFQDMIDNPGLTYLFLNLSGDVEIIQQVMNHLAQFQGLQKLGLSNSGQSYGKWPIDLEQLDVLKSLWFVFLRNADINSGGVGIDYFPWQPAVHTIILASCKFKRKYPGPDPGKFDYATVMLQPQTKTLFQPCKIIELSDEDPRKSDLNGFFN